MTDKNPYPYDDEPVGFRQWVLSVLHRGLLAVGKVAGRFMERVRGG